MSDHGKLSQRRVPGQERSKATIRIIYKAASELFSNESLETVSMTAIANKAGVTKAALYRYFPNKQALMYAMAQRLFLSNRENLIEKMSNHDLSLNENMIQALREYCSIHMREPYRLRIQSATLHDPQIAELEIVENKKNAKLFSNYLHAKFPENTQESLYLRTFLFMELVDGLVRVVLCTPSSETEKLIKCFVERFLGDLK